MGTVLARFSAWSFTCPVDAPVFVVVHHRVLEMGRVSSVSLGNMMSTFAARLKTHVSLPPGSPSYSSDIHITGLLTSDVLRWSAYVYFH